jgi:hypothetical protein
MTKPIGKDSLYQSMTFLSRLLLDLGMTMSHLRRKWRN